MHCTLAGYSNNRCQGQMEGERLSSLSHPPHTRARILAIKHLHIHPSNQHLLKSLPRISMPSPPSAAAGGVFWPDSSTCSLGPVNAPGVPSANTVYYLCATTTSLAAHTRLLTQVWGLTPSNFGFQAAFTNIYTSTPDRGLAAMAMWSYFSCRVPQRMPLGSVEGVWQLQYYTPSLVLSPPPPARTSGAQGGTSRGAGWLLLLINNKILKISTGVSKGTRQGYPSMQ